MKDSLAHLPPERQEQLRDIAKLIQRYGEGVEMVILFGSYARGNWENDPIGGYISDLDLCLITKTSKQASMPKVWTKLRRRARKLSGNASVSFIIHDIRDVNNQLERGRYFFSDIKKEGILLYTSGRFELAREKPSTPAERQAYAQACFDMGFEKANDFYEYSQLALQQGKNSLSAFLLHQATETYYKTVLLVFTAYQPKEHDLEELGKKCGDVHLAFRRIFPTKDIEDERRFKLLEAAYVGARYSMSYRITREELEILAGHVRTLAAATERACKEHIASITA